MMKVLACACLLSVVHVVLGTQSSAGSPTVKIAQGELRGRTYTTIDGRTVYGFLGLPFARPPVGDLRFESPQPPSGWQGVRNATQDGNACVQNNLLDFRNRAVTFGDEDCLYLNVFTPTLNTTAKLPVMVYIYGGGFFAGSPTSLLYGPDYILDHDVVLVVPNYRLGPLGFLSTEDRTLPGNYGLKDQTAALEWIQKNILVFGGNKNSVTIFGNSAGAASVHLHTISPLSEGLFHAGISQSGSALCQWAAGPLGYGRSIASRAAADMGCPTNCSEDLVKCMKKVPAYNLTALTYKYLTFDLDPTVSFPPTIEPNTPSAFMPQDPWTVSASVPWMAGVNAQEGCMRISSLTRGGAEGVARVAKLNAEYKKLLPQSIMVERHAADPEAIAETVKQHYFGQDAISKAKLTELLDMYSDSWFTYCTAEAVRRHNGPAYQYYFSYKGNKTIAPFCGNAEDDLGVCHVDELIYLFPLNAYFPNRTDTPEDIQFSKDLVKLWVNFAKYRNPTPIGSSIHWDAVDPQLRNYLNMNNSGYQMENFLLKDRFNFWQNLSFREKPAAVN